MQPWRPRPAVVDRLYRQARADRWGVALEAFAAALERSVRRTFPGDPAERDVERYLGSLHLEDLALACACAAGHEPAWEHFVREYRPVLYRAADAIDPGGGARDLADSLYGELYGLSEREGERRSHFHYFHGRSSLATWLRAVLSQRHVDRVRGSRNFDPLPSDEGAGAMPSSPEPHSPGRAGHIASMRRAIGAVVARLAPRDRFRLACYYAQGLTLAQIGRLLGEHEATVSRNLARTRRAIRGEVERHLRERQHMSDAEISECFDSVVSDAGSLNVEDLLGTSARAEAAIPAPGRTLRGETETRKETGRERSKERPGGANV